MRLNPSTISPLKWECTSLHVQVLYLPFLIYTCKSCGLQAKNVVNVHEITGSLTNFQNVVGQ